MIALTALELFFLVICVLCLMTIPVCIYIFVDWIQTEKELKKRRKRAQMIPNPADMEPSVRWNTWLNHAQRNPMNNFEACECRECLLRLKEYRRINVELGPPQQFKPSKNQIHFI